SNNGFLAVGSTRNIGSSRFAINGLESDVDLLGIYNSNGAVLVAGDNRGVALGGSAASAFGLNVKGTVQGTLVTAPVVTPKTLNISGASGGLVVSSEGNVGIGTTSPVAQLELTRTFTRPENLASPLSLHAFDLALDSGAFAFDLSAVQVVATSSSLSYLGDLSGTSISGIGLNVDLSGLALSSNGVIKGVYVVPTDNPGMNSAILTGGRVGVRTSDPSATLEVAGKLTGGNIHLDSLSDWTLREVTANTVLVSGDGVMDSVDASAATVPVESLVITSSLVNNIPGDRVYPIVTATDIAASVATFDRLVIPTFNGDMKLYSGSTFNVISVSGSMITDRLTVAGDITSNAFGVVNNLNISGAVSLNRQVVVNEVAAVKSLRLEGTTTPMVRPTSDSFLYVDTASGNNLIFANRVADVTANLSLSVSASANRIGYFNAAKQFASDGYLDVVTLNEVGILRVGTTSSTVRADGVSILKVTGQIPTVSATSSTLYSTGMSVGSRTAGSPTTINAATVVLGKSGDKLRASDTAGGIRVEFDSSVTSNVVNRGGNTVSGNFRAATFMAGSQSSGNVLIITSPNIPLRGSADLYIATVVTTNGRADFVVQTTINSVIRDLVIVSNNGNVGFGSSSNIDISRVAINGLETGVDSLAVYNSAGAILVVDDNRGLGLGGVSGLNKGAWINGQLSATLARSGSGITPKTINISGSNGGLVVSSAGNVGIGTTSPVAQLELTRSFARPENLTSALTMQTVSINTSGKVSADMAAVQLVVTSSALTTFGDLNGTSVAAVGLNVDGSSLGLGAGGVLRGIYVSPTTNAKTLSMVLTGGPVGVGVVGPQSALEISGTLAGGNVELTSPSDWSVVNVTANRIFVTNDAVLGDVDVVSGIVTADSLTVTSPLVSSLPGYRIYPVVIATDLIAEISTFNRLVFPTYNADMDLYSGTTSEQSMVVSGSMVAAQMSLVSGEVSANTIGVTQSMMISGGVSLNRKMVSTAGLAVKTLLLTGRTTPAVHPTSDSYLYVDTASSNNLIFVNRVADVTANLSLAVSAEPNRIGYFNSAKQLASDGYMDMVTVNSIQMTRIGTKSETVRAGGTSILKMLSQIPTVSSSGMTQYSVDLLVGARTVGSATTINSMAIKLGNSGDVLMGGDTASGLIVEFGSSVSADVKNRVGNSVSGSIRAATFMAGSQTSGNVLIVTSANSPIRGLADLYIATTVTKNGRGDFLVQSTVNNGLRDLLIVSNNGFVAVGSTANLTRARLAINGLESGVDLLGVYNSGAPVLVFGDSLGVGIGALAPTSGVWINGTGKAVTSNTGSLVSKTLNVSTGNGGLVVSNAGNVGIGTSAPSAQFELSRSFLRPENLIGKFTMQTVSVDITAATVPTNISMVELTVTSAAKTSVGDLNGSSISVTGLSIDGAALSLDTNGVFTGIYVSPTQSAKAVSAILTGGHVGLGVSSPQAALDMAGTLSGGNVLLTTPKDWSIVSVTANIVSVSGDGVMDVFDAPNQVINVPDAFYLGEATGETQLPRLETQSVVNFIDVTAAVATFNRLVMPTLNADMNLYTGVTATVLAVSGSMVVKDVTINIGTVTANTLGVEGQLKSYWV
ncbi:hypothetical protein EBR57_03095, partial [bacterium]|nr:hypothetical protein [bacterium]